jgi:hypothetical protein
VVAVGTLGGMDLLSAPGYDVARLLLQRGVALVYVLAFASVLYEWRPLLGERGLTPVPRFVQQVPWRRSPSLFHRWYDDRLATGLAWGGLALALAMLLGLADVAPTSVVVPLWLVLYGLYLSYVNVGQLWYGFGWESLLLEAGVLVALLGGADAVATWPALVLVRWLLVRVEVGAGLIKLRGDPCWRELTCLVYHHETQPLPGPLSRRFHLLPRWAHRVEAGANHVVQLVVPFGLLLPQPMAGIAAVAIVVTQSWLLLSGNFAWLNLLTIVLALGALPDSWFEAVAPGAAVGPTDAPVWWLVVVLGAFAWFAWASRIPVANLLSADQRMNASHNPLHLAGSYGAFGSVTRVRYELVVEGRRDGGDWRAYEFRAKPQDPARRPPQVAPFHLRTDWLLWFAAMSPSPGRRDWWVRALVAKLLDGDPLVQRLLRRDPFGGQAPTAVRVRRVRYRFTTAAERRATGDVWVTQDVGTWYGPVTSPTSVPRR